MSFFFKEKSNVSESGLDAWVFFFFPGNQPYTRLVIKKIWFFLDLNFEFSTPSKFIKIFRMH